MTPADDVLAKKRFFALTLLRITGALLVMFGFTLIAGGLIVAGQPTDRWIGAGVVLLGAFDFAVFPLILARRWRSPKQP